MHARANPPTRKKLINSRVADAKMRWNEHCAILQATPELSLRPRSLALLLLTACGNDVNLGISNADPGPVIRSHDAESVLYQGHQETFEGIVSDDDNAATDLMVEWQLGGSVICEGAAPVEASSSCTAAVPEAPSGTLILTMTAWDPSNERVDTSVTIAVLPTTPPEISLSSPLEDGVYYSDVPISVEGAVTDKEDPLDELVLDYTVGVETLQAQPGTDGVFAELFDLAQGTHTVTVMLRLPRRPSLWVRPTMTQPAKSPHLPTATSCKPT